jgi:hypothetical protein
MMNQNKKASGDYPPWWAFAILVILIALGFYLLFRLEPKFSPPPYLSFR